MRICIYGLGAVGGLMAARLAAAGQQVSAIARGATLAAVTSGGLRLIETVDGKPVQSAHPVRVAADPAELGVQDLVVISVKTTGLREVARRIAPLIGPQTIVLSAMNGVPWWFFHGLDAGLAAREWPAIDEGGEVGRAIAADRVLGCVVHLACAMPEPGTVRHTQGQKLIIGEPAGGDSERCARVAALLTGAGFEVEVSQRIQQAVWFKLWGNMTINPISAFTGATTDLILDDPQVRDFVSAAMREASAIGAKMGLPIAITPEERHVVTRKLGAFKSSMLQDVEAGKPVELDSLVTIVVELGRALGVATPVIDSLLGLARLHARVHGLYPR
ncbi:MAG: 2-dehydropantoate 2-reductase [Burkholderiales bacterium]|nr:2-dehydropantoate 2-reductase [Burkholderiales bacterium]